VIQAGRGRLCYAEYRHSDGQWRRESDVEVGALDDLAARLEGSVSVLGELDQEERDTLKARFAEAVYVAPPAFALRRAAFLADIAWQRFERGEIDDTESLSPTYLHTSNDAGAG
jgi:tRNA threonylcarbamoyladenosine biosynthesis protein TsaB